ncbi:hypothetical protein, partial [Pandoraea sp. SD6-2]|uniref:hypothetical protein n=1 Tax=Pandoraea sp. SD6-2 TaxID=1286093 RepID=UPI000330211D
AKLASDAAAKQALLDQEKVALDGRRLEAQKRELADAQARAKGASDQAQADAQRQAVLDGQRLEAQKRESDDAQARAKAASDQAQTDHLRRQWQTQESIDALGLAKLASDAAAKQALLDQEKVALDGRRLEAQKRESDDAQARAKAASDQVPTDREQHFDLLIRAIECEKTPRVKCVLELALECEQTRDSRCGRSRDIDILRLIEAVKANATSADLTELYRRVMPSITSDLYRGN